MWTSTFTMNHLGWTILAAICWDMLFVYRTTDLLGPINWSTTPWVNARGQAGNPWAIDSRLNPICDQWEQRTFKFEQIRCFASSASESGGRSERSERSNSARSAYLRWVATIAGGVGLLFVVKTLSSDPTHEWQYNELKTSIYKLLPLRLASKCWGVINDVNLPRPLRKPVIGVFAWYTGCDISEAAVDDPQEYPNLSQFFRRTLKPGLRPIHPGDCVVSPSDGKILNYGEVKEGFVEQVKGISYPLQTFLGPHPWSDNGVDQYTDEHAYHQQMLKNKDGSTALFHCVVYLAPGDYHRFHSPADWTVLRRRHFPGKLLSVKPRVASWVKGLFNINERVVYCGEWEHGFFSMTAVGATNVGSIKCIFDETLATNKLLYKKNTWCDFTFNEKPVKFSKGDDFGEFNMGSTMVMIFEAPKDFQWNLKDSQKIKYGELIAGQPKKDGAGQ